MCSQLCRAEQELQSSVWRANCWIVNKMEMNLYTFMSLPWIYSTSQAVFNLSFASLVLHLCQNHRLPKILFHIVIPYVTDPNRPRPTIWVAEMKKKKMRHILYIVFHIGKVWGGFWRDHWQWICRDFCCTGSWAVSNQKKKKRKNIHGILRRMNWSLLGQWC